MEKDQRGAQSGGDQDVESDWDAGPREEVKEIISFHVEQVTGMGPKGWSSACAWKGPEPPLSLGTATLACVPWCDYRAPWPMRTMPPGVL